MFIKQPLSQSLPLDHDQLSITYQSIAKYITSIVQSYSTVLSLVSDLKHGLHALQNQDVLPIPFMKPPQFPTKISQNQD
jgi:hypothetical protein